MAEYWKSTPSYWCKFCEIYVRDTPIERKNHESTGKHQNNIQRQLRDLHKRKERENRDQQRAKDEVARLNGLVGGKDTKTAAKPGISGFQNLGKASAPVPPKISAAAQRKKHAEELIALGVPLPEELKREVTGVSDWHTVSSNVVESSNPGGRTLAEIKKEEEDSAAASGALSKGVHKRKAEDEEDARDEEAAPKRKIWGNALKSYPGNQAEEDDDEDLDALLSGVGKKTAPSKTNAAAQETKHESDVKAEPEDTAKSETAAAVAEPADQVKTEQDNESAVTAPPPVMFKKRKTKK